MANKIQREDISVRKFVGADAPALLSVVSDFLMALWMTPSYNIRGSKDPKDFLVKMVSENTADKIVEDIILFTNIDRDVISLIISFAANNKTGLEYKEIEASLDLDEVLLVTSVVLEKFLKQFINTSFFLSLRKEETSPVDMQDTASTEK